MYLFPRSTAVLLLLLPATSQADLMRTISGPCEEGQFVAVDVTIAFTQTGGDFGNGTGTAAVEITLENTSGVYPYQNPAIGNPVWTGFIFNVPPNASVQFVDARILAGSNIVSTGTTMSGVHIPPGCTLVESDQSQPAWYELRSGSSGGQYGFFTNSLETDNGVKAGLVDPDVYPDCVEQGDVFSPLVVAGKIQFVLELGNLNSSMNEAEDFLNQCSNSSGSNDPHAFAAKFQATGTDGEESCRVADLGNCVQVSTSEKGWGMVKTLFR